MHAWKLPSLFRVLPVALGLVLYGCSARPMVPLEAAIESSSAQQPLTPPPYEKTAPFVTTSVVIDGSRGGIVKLGKWMVRVPRGAYSGTGTITIVVDSLTASTCDLTISPATLNAFKVPVVLMFKLKTRTEIPFKQLYRWDPAVQGWRPIPTAPDYQQVGVQSPLLHFSRYGCESKAGW